MKPLKTSRVIEVCLWVSVFVLLLACVQYFSEGGTWYFNKEFDVNKKISDHIDIGNLKEAKREEVEIQDIGLVEMNLADANVEIEFVEGDTVEIVELTNDKKQENLFETTKKENGLYIERPKNDEIFQFGFMNQSAHLVQVKIPRNLKEEFIVYTSSGDIEVQNEMVLESVEIGATSGDIILAAVQVGESQIGATSGDINIESIRGSEHQITTTSGDINIEEGTGDFKIKTTSGKKTLGHIVGNEHEIEATSGSTKAQLLEGQCKISSTSGDIQIGQLIGAMENKITSTSGRIALEEVEGFGKMKTTSGEIDIDCMTLSGDLDIASTSGSIYLGINPEMGSEVEIATVSGDIEGNADIQYEDRNEHKAIVKIGTGDTYNVQIKTTSGEVELDEI